MPADPWNPVRIGVGAAGIVVATATAAVLPASREPLRPVVVVVVVGWCAYRMVYVREGLVLAAFGFLMINGFLTGSYARAPWDIVDSGGYVLLLVLTTFIGLGQRRIRAAQADPAPDAALDHFRTGSDTDDGEGSAR